MASHLLHRVNTDVVIKETFLKWCIIQGEKKRKKTTETVTYLTYATNRKYCSEHILQQNLGIYGHLAFFQVS